MSSLKQLKRQFLEYIEIEKGRAFNTVANYDRYLTRFLNFTKNDNPENGFNNDKNDVHQGMNVCGAVHAV